MSSPFTAPFLRTWRSLNAPRNLLARIDLTTPSALSLYVAKAETVTPDGRMWLGRIISSDPVRFPGGHLSPGPDLASATFTLSTGRVQGQTSGDLIDIVAAYQWKGAAVTLWYWSELLASFNDAAQIFAGVIDSVSPAYDPARGASLELGCVMGTRWDRPFPPTTVNAIDDPDAPDAVQGQPKPVIYGPFTALNDKSPAVSAFAGVQYRENGGCGSGAVPSLVIGRGISAAKRKVCVAGHALQTLWDRPTGHSLFVAGDQQLDPIDAATSTLTGGGDGTYTIDDDALFAFHGGVPFDVRIGGGYNTAGDPRNACDVFDMTSFAVLDQNLGLNRLQLQLPNINQLGAPKPGAATKIMLAWIGDIANTHNIRVRPQLVGSGAYAADCINVASTVATYTIDLGNWTGGGTPAWNLGGDPSIAAPVDVVVDFVGGTTNKARIYWIAIPILYTPYESVITPAFTVATILPAEPRRGRRGLPQNPIGGLLRTEHAAATALSSMFYANPIGYADDGGGTFTGSAGAVVLLPPDIVRHLLVTYGGLTAATDFEMAAGTFGSFLDARATVRCEQPAGNFTLSAFFNQRATVSEALKSLCEQALLRLQLDPRGSGAAVVPQWRIHAWRRGGTTDYDRVLEREDIQSLRGPLTGSRTDSRNALRVRYRYDWLRSRFWLEAFVNNSGSARGYNLPDVPDCRLAVDATNDQVDWASAGTFADTLAHAVYTDPMDLALDAQTKMRVHAAALAVGYGGFIRSGVNDKLDVTVGATPYHLTLIERDWSLVDLAEHVAEVLNAAGTGLTFTCVYNDATNLFTIAASGVFSLLAASGTNALTGALPTLGWITDQVAAATYDGETERYHGRFWFLNAANIQLLWASGASVATNAAQVLGFDRSVDLGFARSIAGTYQVNAHEALCVASAAENDARRELVVDASHVRNEGAAQDLRNRLLEAIASPPRYIELTTYRAPDLFPMNIFKLGASVDELIGCGQYAGSSSWAGAKWRVDELELGTGPFWGQRIRALAADTMRP